MTEDFNKWWDRGTETASNPFDDASPEYWAYEGWVAGQKAAYAKCIAECKAETKVKVANAHPAYHTGREMGATLCMNRITALDNLNKAAEDNGEEL